MNEVRRPPTVRWYASLYVQVLIGAALGVVLGYARAAPGGQPETAGRWLYQAGQDDHRAGDLLHRDQRHRRSEQPGAGRPRRAEGARLLHRGLERWRCCSGLAVANLVQPGAGFNADPTHLDAGAVASYQTQAHSRTRGRVPAARHPRHHRRRLHDRRHPAGAAGLDPVWLRARACRRARALACSAGSKRSGWWCSASCT